MSESDSKLPTQYRAIGYAEALRRGLVDASVGGSYVVCLSGPKPVVVAYHPEHEAAERLAGEMESLARALRARDEWIENVVAHVDSDTASPELRALAKHRP